MNNEDIVKYCTTSPENINPAVLRSMLDSIEGGGGDEYGEPLLVDMYWDNENGKFISRKTWQEIYDEITINNKIVYFYVPYVDGTMNCGVYMITAIYTDDAVYDIGFNGMVSEVNNPTDYPSYDRRVD